MVIQIWKQFSLVPVPLSLGEVMGKVKAMYAEMEKEVNWDESDQYYDAFDAGVRAAKKESTRIDIFSNLINKVLKRLDDLEYKMYKLEKEKEA